jgi:hypothetical protein
MAHRNSQPIAQSNVAKQSGAVSVLTTTTVVAGNNPARSEITVTNDGANIVYLQLATAEDATGATAGNPTAPTAVASQGIRLAASGGSWTSQAYTGPVAGIALTGATTVTIVEV